LDEFWIILLPQRGIHFVFVLLRFFHYFAVLFSSFLNRE
jgi:hypothetical protein